MGNDRPIWQVDMGDGTWAASCQACQVPLGRGPRAQVDQAARNHRCTSPNGRRRLRAAERS